MSNFKITAIKKDDGTTHEVWCLDNHFGRRRYGYSIKDNDESVLTETEFLDKFEPDE